MEFTNVLNDADISNLLQNETVTTVLSNNVVKTRFRMPLPDTVKEKLKFGLGLDLFSVPEVPMMYIRGDMAPHVDSGVSDFKNTYLVYLTDSGGKFVVEGAEYDIQKGCGFKFERGLSHGTTGTEGEGRLMIGPLSDMGFEVGAVVTYYSNLANANKGFSPIRYGGSYTVETVGGISSWKIAPDLTTGTSPGGNTIYNTDDNLNSGGSYYLYPADGGDTITIGASADASTGVSVRITNFGEGQSSDDYTLYINYGTNYQQSKINLTEWVLGETQTFSWADIDPPLIRGGSIKISLLNTDRSILSNDVEVTVSNDLEISATADLSGVTLTVSNFSLGSDTDIFNLGIDVDTATQQVFSGFTFGAGISVKTFLWTELSPDDTTRTNGQTITVIILNTDNSPIQESNKFTTVITSGNTPPTITATASFADGISVRITDFGSGNDTNTFSLLIDEGLSTQQSKTGLTGWVLDSAQIYNWSTFTPPGRRGRVGGEPVTIKLTNTTADPDTNSNIVSTTLTGNGGPPTITATADYTAGITVTITNFGKGSASDTFSLLLDVDITGKEQTKTGLTGWILNTPRTIAWADLTPSGLEGRVGGETITVQISNTTGETFSNIISANLTGSGGIPCFVANSNLLTPTGYVAAKDIKTGDLLMTADGRQVPVKSYSFTVEKTDKETSPFFIPKNSISMGCPNADLRLSPWHAFQMKKGLWMKPMSALELGMSVQQYDLGKSVTYYHFEAPDFFKDNFVCEGTVVESFGGIQTKDFKGRVYTYNANLKGYTRAASKSVNKAIMM